MNTLDIILCVPLIWGLYRGFCKGLIIEVATLIALALGIYGGVYFSDFTAEALAGYVDDDASYVPILSFAITFIGIVLIVYMIAKVLEKIINLIQLKLINKLSGAFFGLLKTALILSVIIMIVDVLDRQLSFIPRETKIDSILYQPVSSFAPTLLPVLSDQDWYATVLNTPEED